jgi:hypothetical protein
VKGGHLDAGGIEQLRLECRSRSLIREKSQFHAMRHCVGTYVDKVMAGYCYIYSIRKHGKRVATAEIMRAGDRMKLGQIRGPCNARVHEKIVATVRQWMRQQNRRPINP